MMFESSIVSTRSHSMVADVLDRSYARLTAGDTEGGMEALMAQLAGAASHAPDRWQAECAACVEHPIRALLHADPITARAFARPRGYVTDGVLLDLLYRHGSVRSMWEALAPGARAIHEHVAGTGFAQAIRWRMVNFAKAIDETAAAGAGSKVLAVCGGNLREIELSSAVARGRLARFSAVDREATRLDHLLAGVLPLDRFHLIYVPCLTEELDDECVERLIWVLHSALEPRGTLILANATPSTPERGYLEAFMGWRIRYRTPGALGRLVQRATGLMPSISSDPYGRLGYARLERALS